MHSLRREYCCTKRSRFIAFPITRNEHKRVFNRAEADVIYTSARTVAKTSGPLQLARPPCLRRLGTPPNQLRSMLRDTLTVVGLAASLKRVCWLVWREGRHPACSFAGLPIAPDAVHSPAGRAPRGAAAAAARAAVPFIRGWLRGAALRDAGHRAHVG